MARTAQQVAKTLQEIYIQSFGEADHEKYLLNWADLRGIAGVEKLTEDFVTEISEKMSEAEFTLFPLNDSLLVGTEFDFISERKLPARLLERYLPGEDDEDKDIFEDEELED